MTISFQTRSELVAGALVDGWGSVNLGRLRALLDATPTVGVDDEVIEAYAALFADCREHGHGLHGKAHTADRWIASCAIAKGLPLLSGDKIYAGAPGLTLLA